MLNPSLILGQVVRTARARLKYTQVRLAELIGKSERTVIKIEMGEDNPKLDGLFLLIRVLKIDPREIFYPEVKEDRPSVQALCNIVEQCSEAEAAALVPVVQSFLSAIRSKTNSLDFE